MAASNPFTDALEALTADLQAAVGPEILVSRDPAMIMARVSQKGLAVLVDPGVVSEPSSYRSWFMDVAVNVVFGTPADPSTVDPAYSVAHTIMTSDAAQFVSMDPRTIQLDSASALPALTVTLRISTEC